jgi:DNA-binding transcriptional ArsR family regulator
MRMYADTKMRSSTEARPHDLSVLTDPTRDAAARTLRLLSDATRLHLLWHLRESERAVGDLCRAVDRPSPAVSQHLAKLRLGGLVLTRREGTQIFYRLATDHVRELVVDVVAHAQHLEETR